MSQQNAVFLGDGRLQHGCTLSPQQVLMQYGTGVYTTALITSEGMVVDWGRHRQRLLRGIELLNTRTDRPFQALLSALEAQGSTLTDLLSRHVTPAVRAALEAYHAPHDRPAQTSDGPPPGPPAEHAMLVVCIAPRSAEAQRAVEAAAVEGRAAAAASAAAAQREPQGCVGACVSEPQLGGAGEASTLPVAVGVYIKSVQPPPYGPEHAVQAAVMGRPRSLAGAKAASWVAERRGYEAARPAEAAEVLLSDADGRILEGLTTNFAVITVAAGDGDGAAGGDGDSGGAAASSSPATTPGGGGVVTLHTCAPASGAALPGVVQGRLLEAAAALGMRVELAAPAVGDRGAWREAFISNCIKRVQPLSRVFCPPGNAWGADPWDCVLPRPAGPHTSALRRELERLEEHTHWRQLE